MRSTACLLIFALALEAQTPLAWDELAAVVVERQAVIPLAGGKRVEGEILAVRPDGIVMDIRKTRDRQNYPPGQGFIPRAEVREVRLVRHRGALELAGGIAGTAGGAILVAAVAVSGGTAAIIPMMVLAWPMAGVGGYYAGKAAGRHTRVITVAP